MLGCRSVAAWFANAGTRYDFSNVMKMDTIVSRLSALPTVASNANDLTANIHTVRGVPRVGICTENPTCTLDVAGSLRTSQDVAVGGGVTVAGPTRLSTVVADSLACASVSGHLTGGVTGDVTGSSSSCTGNAATATTALNVGGGGTVACVSCSTSDLSVAGPALVADMRVTGALTVQGTIFGNVAGSSTSCTGNAATASFANVAAFAATCSNFATGNAIDCGRLTCQGNFSVAGASTFTGPVIAQGGLVGNVSGRADTSTLAIVASNVYGGNVDCGSAAFSGDARIDGDAFVRSRMVIGRPGGSQNGLYFAGTTGDFDTGSRPFSCVLNRNYDATADLSELLVFQGNDTPDRIRCLSGTHLWQVYGQSVVPSDAATFWDDPTYRTALFIDASGRVAVGSRSPASELDVVGSIRASGDALVSGTLTGAAASVVRDLSVGGQLTVSGGIAGALSGPSSSCTGNSATATYAAAAGTANSCQVASFATTASNVGGSGSVACASVDASAYVASASISCGTLMAQSAAVLGNLSVGTTGAAQNGLYFAGTPMDNGGPSAAPYSCILNRSYAGQDHSEMLFFQGNDAASLSGPARIRAVAPAPVWQGYDSTVPPVDSATVWNESNFRTSMVINSLGAVGLGGVAAPNYPLEVNGPVRVNAGDLIYEKLLVVRGGGGSDPTNFYGFGADSNALRYQTMTSATHAFYAGETRTMTLDGAGNLVAIGNVSAYSDVRLKSDVERIGDPLGKIAKLSGYTYRRTDLPWVNPERRFTGVLAQEVEEVLPEAVEVDTASGMMSVAYGNMVGLLVEGIKGLADRVEALASRVDRLEAR